MNSLLTGRLENNHQLNVDRLTNVSILVCVVTEKRDRSYFIFRLNNKKYIDIL